MDLLTTTTQLHMRLEKFFFVVNGSKLLLIFHLVIPWAAASVADVPFSNPHFQCEYSRPAIDLTP